jgi:hypothetical protein
LYVSHMISFDWLTVVEFPVWFQAGDRKTSPADDGRQQ